MAWATRVCAELLRGGVWLWVSPGEEELVCRGRSCGRARLGLRAFASLPFTLSAAASLSHGASLPPAPAPAPGFPDSWGRHTRTAGPEGPQQPALVNQLQIPSRCCHEVLDSLHPTEGKGEGVWGGGAGGEDWLRGSQAPELT